jgi:hypothetical protein
VIVQKPQEFATLGAFVLLENKKVLNYARDGAILPHSGNPCQVEIHTLDPKLQ